MANLEDRGREFIHEFELQHGLDRHRRAEFAAIEDAAVAAFARQVAREERERIASIVENMHGDSSIKIAVAICGLEDL